MLPPVNILRCPDCRSEVPISGDEDHAVTLVETEDPDIRQITVRCLLKVVPVDQGVVH